MSFEMNPVIGIFSNNYRLTRYKNEKSSSTRFHWSKNSINYPPIQGTYVETDTDYSVFFEDGSGMIYTKFENGSIAMKSENASVFVQVESTGLQKLGLN